jgi:hypothetical protein
MILMSLLRILLLGYNLKNCMGLFIVILYQTSILINRVRGFIRT